MRAITKQYECVLVSGSSGLPLLLFQQPPVISQRATKSKVSRHGARARELPLHAETNGFPRFVFLVSFFLFLFFVSLPTFTAARVQVKRPRLRAEKRGAHIDRRELARTHHSSSAAENAPRYFPRKLIRLRCAARDPSRSRGEEARRGGGIVGGKRASSVQIDDREEMKLRELIVSSLGF